MTFHIITIFPKIFDSYFNESIIKRALKNNLIDIKIHNLRDWTTDNHQTVDDKPFGGGAGMVMKIEPLYKALNSPLIKGPPAIASEALRAGVRGIALAPLQKGGRGVSSKTILLSAKGKTWNQKMAKSHAKLNNIILICGRYEGVDERVKKIIDEEISIGDYVLTGGELGAAVIVDSITRLLPGVLGNAESSLDESHTQPGILEYPQYTKPASFIINGRKHLVPKILLSGDHKKINQWREMHKKRVK